MLLGPLVNVGELVKVMVLAAVTALFSVAVLLKVAALLNVVVLPKVSVPVKVCEVASPAMVSEVAGKVCVVLSVPLKVSVLFTVRDLPAATLTLPEPFPGTSTCAIELTLSAPMVSAVARAAKSHLDSFMGYFPSKQDTG